MVDQELIKAISQMMDEKFKTELKPIKDDLDYVKQDLRGVQQDLKGVQQDLDEVHRELKEVHEKVDKIEFQTDTLYNWVDTVDIRSKNTMDIVENVSKYQPKKIAPYGAKFFCGNAFTN